MFDIASAAVEAALAAGASYADARYVEGRDEFIQVMNGGIETLNRSEGAGVGVRALVGSSWGFFATADVDAASLRKAGRQAVEIARASAVAPGRPMPLADVPIVDADYETPVVEAPLEVPLAEKVDMLLGVTADHAGRRGRPSRPGLPRSAGTPISGSCRRRGPPHPPAHRRDRRGIRRHRGGRA